MWLFIQGWWCLVEESLVVPSRVCSKVKLCANDALLYSYIKSEVDCHALQEDLDALAQWAHIWQMEFIIPANVNF